MIKRSTLLLTTVAVGASLVCGSAHAQTAPAPEPAAPAPREPEPPAPPAAPAAARPALDLGIGYKLGNGIGFEGGDLILTAPHIGLDFMASLFAVPTTTGNATGYALAPELVGTLRAFRSTPYAGVGLQYAVVSHDGISAHATGFFFNVGYEWRWESGFGIQLGGGIQHINGATASDGVTTISIGGITAPNLEFGIRYMFF